MKLGYFTMPVHPPARSYVETLKEDREAFILADRLGYSGRVLRRAPHRRGREHPQQPDVHRDAARRDLADEGRDRRGQPSAQPSGGGRHQRRDARQPVRRPLHPRDRRRHPALRRRGAGTARRRPQRHVRGSDRPHSRAVGGDGADRSQGEILEHLDGEDDLARDRHRRHRQALSEAASADRRHRDRPGLQGADRARPPRLVADLVAFPAPQLPARASGRTTPRAAPKAGTSPTAPTGASRARSSSPRTTRWPGPTAATIPTAPIAST